jgi:hypothetical protein
MYPRGSLSESGAVEALVARFGRLTPDTSRRWGRMTAHQMLCHLGDAFDAVMGDRPASTRETLLTRTVVKFVALRTPVPWPKGSPTLQELDPFVGGTQPADFERDRQRAVRALQRFAEPASPRARHPIFGAMTRDEWAMWAFGHVDHHLRQFGV